MKHPAKSGRNNPARHLNLERIYKSNNPADRLRRLGKAVPILQRGFSPLLPLERNSFISGDDRNLRGQILKGSALEFLEMLDDP